MSGRAQPPRAAIDILTRRELDVLRLVATGERSRDVATKLMVSEATVKSHLNRVYHKLGVRNRVEAASWYIRHQLPQDERATRTDRPPRTRR